MFFKTLTAKALIGAGALSVVGGGAAAAATGTLPMANVAAQATQTPAPSNQAKQRADLTRGIVLSVSDKHDSMVVEVAHRDPKTKAVTKDDVTFFLTNTTKVYRWGSKDPVGLDAITKGERVRVRYAERDGNKYANRVVLVPDVRAGKVTAKGNDNFTIELRDGHTLVISVNDKTRYFDVIKKHDRQPGSFADLKVGDRVLVRGETDKNGQSFDGALVAYHHPAK